MRISDWSSDVCSSDLIDRQVRVDLDPAALQALGVTAGDVSQQLARIQVERAGGKAELDGEQPVIRTDGTIDSANALHDYSITLPDGRAVRLSDAARLTAAPAASPEVARPDAAPVVAFSLSPTPRRAWVAVS